MTKQLLAKCKNCGKSFHKTNPKYFCCSMECVEQLRQRSNGRRGLLPSRFEMGMLATNAQLVSQYREFYRLMERDRDS